MIFNTGTCTIFYDGILIIMIDNYDGCARFYHFYLSVQVPVKSLFII
jgi:hypothetical protein